MLRERFLPFAANERYQEQGDMLGDLQCDHFIHPAAIRSTLKPFAWGVARLATALLTLLPNEVHAANYSPVLDQSPVFQTDNPTHTIYLPYVSSGTTPIIDTPNQNFVNEPITPVPDERSNGTGKTIFIPYVVLDNSCKDFPIRILSGEVEVVLQMD